MSHTQFKTHPIEFTKYIAPDGAEYNFTNGIDQFIVSGVSGMGMPPVTYRDQRGPFQHGTTALGFILQPRLVQLVHRRNTGCRQEYWDARADFMNLIRPNRQLINTFSGGVLRNIQPDGTKRDLCVFIQNGPSFVGSQQGRWDEFSFQEAIQFIAHDPLFFDPGQFLVELTMPNSSDELSFAITFSIVFSSDGSVPLDTITYNGTFKSFPTIFMTGPLKKPIIKNITTGEKIELDTTIVAGRTVTINLEFGNKTVVDDLGNNLIGTLTTDSDLATFHLAADPEAPGGANQIGLGAGNVTAESRVALKYFERYIGI